MERPVKRLKIARSESRSPRETGSKMAEGLFTSEMGMTSDDAETYEPMPTPTLVISELRRRQIRNKPEKRQMLPRANEGVLLRPRAPDATVTATMVDVNVADGTTTISATELSLATDATVVSLSNYSGSLTVPGLSTTASNSTITASDSQSITSDSTITSTTLDAAASILSAALTGNTTITSTDSTVTVTATSTFEVSYINGTFVPAHTKTKHITVTTHVSNTVASTLSLSDNTSPSTDTLATDSTSITATTYQGSNPSTLPPAGAAATSSLSSSTTTTPPSSSKSSTPTPGLTPTQQQMVGGVVGGLAGLALVLVFFLFILRWYRRRLKARGMLPEQHEAISQRGITGPQGGMSGGMMETNHSRTSSGIPFAAAAAMVKRWRPHSGATFATTATATSSATATATATAGAEGSEKGFQRIAGRKIAPVLSTGGDGFGGDYGAFEKDAAAAAAAGGVGRSNVGIATPTDTKHVQRKLSRSSFYRDKDRGGFYGPENRRSSSVPGSPRTPLSPTYPVPMGFPQSPRDFAASNDEIQRQLPQGLAAANYRDVRPSRSDMDLHDINTRALKPEGYAVMRPSPARTLTTESLSVSRGEEGALGLIDGDGERTPPLPVRERGRLLVPGAVVGGGLRGSPAGSRGSGASRFREGI